MRLRAVLISLAALLVSAPAALAQSPVDDAIEALQDDSVYIDPKGPQGFTPESADLYRREIEKAAPGRIFLAILPFDAAGSPEEAIGEVRDGVGKPGTYAVFMDNKFRVDGSDEAEQAATDAFDAHKPDGAQLVITDWIQRMGSLDDSGGGGGGGGGAVIILGAAAVGGGALLLSRRRRRAREAAQFAEVKDNARDDLVALGDDIRALDLDVQMPGLSDATRADYERAVNAYDRADTAWERARTPHDLQPVGEALEEGRWAMESVRARLDGREPPERRPPCFFDPRHGPSTRDVMWSPPTPPGGAPREVPACEADAQSVERGLGAEIREVTLGGRSMPYYAAGPMYAPFMGGYFGGGFLPGLFFGEPFADSWGGGDLGGGDFGGVGGDFGGGDF